MLVTIRYVHGCPGRPIAEERVRDALAELGRDDVRVVLEAVETHEDAVRLGFRGSPTVLVDGEDPFAEGRPDVGLACRVYPTPDGPQGAPPPDRIRAALSG